MSTNEKFPGIETKVLTIPPERYLHHLFNDHYPGQPINVEAIPADSDQPPIFTDPFFLANIGSGEKPILLELRFVPTDHDFWIALLMTNERYPRDLEVMAEEIISRAGERNIDFDAVAAPASLGTHLSQEIARQMGALTPVLALQKGKAVREKNGQIIIDTPKAWIDGKAGIDVSSGTSRSDSLQKLYADQAIVEALGPRKVLLVDDARLSSGTLDSSLILLGEMGVNITGAATVLNEAGPVDEIGIDRIPYVYLTKLPIFDPVEEGLQPREGSYQGLNHFYIRKCIVYSK